MIIFYDLHKKFKKVWNCNVAAQRILVLGVENIIATKKWLDYAEKCDIIKLIIVSGGER